MGKYRIKRIARQGEKPPTGIIDTVDKRYVGITNLIRFFAVSAKANHVFGPD